MGSVEHAGPAPAEPGTGSTGVEPTRTVPVPVSRAGGLLSRELMQLLSRWIADHGRTAEVPAPRTGSSTGPEPDGEATYLLVFNDPDRPAAQYWVGWVLAAWHGRVPLWSVSLTGRGAGAHAGTRVAQAVAVRVLAEQGVPVAGWHADEALDPVVFRARVESPVAGPAEPPVHVPRPRRPGRWGLLSRPRS